MKSNSTRVFFGTTLTALFIACTVHGQVPVTTGLKLHLQDANLNFTSAAGSTPAHWTDNSGSGNDVYAPSAATSPTLVTGANPCVSFNGVDQFLQNASANSSFSAGKATIFVVRIAPNDTIQNQVIPTYHTTVSISDDNSWNEELSLQTDAVAHHSSSGNWTERHQQCYASLPEDEPAIITGIFEGVPEKIDMQVNGISSNRPILDWGNPWTMSNINRRIHIGARVPGYFFEGKILEVLAYDHVLTGTEITSVNDYLKCKHEIKYTTCNNPVDCSTPTSINDVTKQKNILSQNTANPFIGTTTVAYNINNMNKEAAITVHDLNGRLLRNYAINRRGAGSVEISADGLTPGIYFYTLTVDGNKVDTKRMSVLR